MGEGIPPAPIVDIYLTNFVFNDKTKQKKCKALLDTGSDFTLVPTKLAYDVDAHFLGRSKTAKLFGVGGGSISYIPCCIGIVFDNRYFPNVDVLACHEEDLEKNLYFDLDTRNNPPYQILMGRDFLNQHKLKFDGSNLEFSVTKVTSRHPKAVELASPVPLLHRQN
jgi:hypothetical protein